jgi:hypothetical protein
VPYIYTVKGRQFSLDHPNFDIEEMAHSLSMQCRFTGHCKRFYSVAEHSLTVSRLCRFFGIGSPLEGLLHDAHEAYISDIASPWKARLPDYVDVEHHLEHEMRMQFGLPAKTTVKRADTLALFIEAHHLLANGMDGLFPEGINEEIRKQAEDIADAWFLDCWTPAQAKCLFLSEYYVLQQGVAA